MTNYQQHITIAGMGKTGSMIDTFLSSFSIAAKHCDDNLDYPDCLVESISYPGFIFKSPGLDPEKYISLPDKVHVINDIEFMMRLTLKPVILVTGTNGKSTLVSLLEAILESSNIHAIACGNNGIPVLKAHLARPDIYIIELSSYQLENMSSHVSEAAVVLNVGVDHVERYIHIDHYRSIKESIYQNCQHPVWPINQDGDLSYGQDIVGYRVGTSDYTVKGEFIYQDQYEYCNVADIALVGQHNYLNVCAALALLHHLQLSQDKVVAELKQFVGLAHRMELICSDIKGRKWINDSKSTNVHSTKAALVSLNQQIILIMGGRGKGEDYSELFSEYADKISMLILYGEDADLISSQADSVVMKYILSSVSEAVELANTYADTVLFSPACASFDQYRDFSERGDDFKYHVRRVVVC